MIAIVILIFLVVISLSWFLYYAWKDSFIKSLKGPTPFPFVGTFTQILHVPANLFQYFKEIHDMYGKTVRMYLCTEQLIITKEKKFIEIISTHSETINKSRVYGYLHNWLGEGLLTSKDKKWRSRRKLITPAYHFQVLDQFMEIFERNGNILIDKLRKEVGSKETDIYPYINLFSLDTICETSMGTQVNAQINNKSDFVKSTKIMNRIIYARTFSMIKSFDCLYKFTKDCKLEKKALKVIHGYTISVIKSRHEELSKIYLDSPNLTNHVFEMKRKDNFLDILLKSSINGAPLSDEDIREEVDTFTFEGHDTVSSGMSFALFAIANHPEIQERLIEEQRVIFGKNPTGATTLKDLSEMKYLDMVIKESIRLYPPVPIIGRTINKDITYKDLHLKKGVQIMISILELHRDSDNFSDPLKFDPDRFLPENSVRRHPYAYIPFSAGHRNCIGQKFAMLEMKSTIAKVLRNFELLPLEIKYEFIFLPESILRAENGILINLEERKW